MTMDGPVHYEIRVAEQLDERWENWFDGLDIIHSESAGTLLKGEMADQPALFGVLGKIRDLGLTLISLQRLDGVSFWPPVTTSEPSSNDAGDEGR